MTAGEGRPILLLHGFTGSARSWSAQTDVWAEQQRVIAPDLLGHAGSAAPRDPSRYALERQARDVVELMRLLDASPAAVVGYSMGARIALVLALRFPDAVERLVLESPSAGIADAEARVRRASADEALAQDLERDGIAAFVERWERSPLFASHAQLPRAARERLRAERLAHQPLALAASLRGAGQGVMEPLHDRLDRIATPTLVIAGALDPQGLERARTITRSLPDARCEVIRGAGHTPHLERPLEFTDVVGRFLSAIPSTSPP